VTQDVQIVVAQRDLLELLADDASASLDAGNSLGVSRLALIGSWFVAYPFGVRFGLVLCLVDAFANLSHVIARWLYIDNKAFPIR